MSVGFPSRRCGRTPVPSSREDEVLRQEDRIRAARNRGTEAHGGLRRLDQLAHLLLLSCTAKASLPSSANYVVRSANAVEGATLPYRIGIVKTRCIENRFSVDSAGGPCIFGALQSIDGGASDTTAPSKVLLGVTRDGRPVRSWCWRCWRRSRPACSNTPVPAISSESRVSASLPTLAEYQGFANDDCSKARKQYVKMGGPRSNTRYGWIRTRA
jgi:hypothetical protein